MTPPDPSVGVVLPFNLGQAMGLLLSISDELRRLGRKELGIEARELATQVHDFAQRVLNPEAAPPTGPVKR